MRDTNLSDFGMCAANIHRILLAYIKHLRDQFIFEINEQHFSKKKINYGSFN